MIDWLITNGQIDGQTTVSCQDPIILRAVRTAKIEPYRQQTNSNANNDKQTERDGYTDVLRVNNAKKWFHTFNPTTNITTLGIYSAIYGAASIVKEIMSRFTPRMWNRARQQLTRSSQTTRTFNKQCHWLAPAAACSSSNSSSSSSSSMLTCQHISSNKALETRYIWQATRIGNCPSKLTA